MVGTLSWAPYAQRNQDAGLACPTSAELAGWLIQHQLSLAFTTYCANCLLFLSVGAAGELKRHERLFDRPMGLYAHGEALWMATRRPIYHLNGLALQDGIPTWATAANACRHPEKSAGWRDTIVMFAAGHDKITARQLGQVPCPAGHVTPTLIG